MSLKERITEDMKTAMRGAQKERLGTVRMILAAVKQREVDERVTLDDAQVLAVIDKMVKQRKESIASFEAGGRADLVAKEAAEIETLISAAIASTGAASIKDMGKVMGVLKSELAGRADMGAVSARIKQKL